MALVRSLSLVVKRRSPTRCQKRAPGSKENLAKALSVLANPCVVKRGRQAAAFDDGGGGMDRLVDTLDMWGGTPCLIVHLSTPRSNEKTYLRGEGLEEGRAGVVGQAREGQEHVAQLLRVEAREEGEGVVPVVGVCVCVYV